MSGNVFDAVLSRFESMSPEAYLKLSEADRAAIARVRVSPPRLGEPGFGKLVVEFDSPRYVVNRIRDRARRQ